MKTKSKNPSLPKQKRKTATLGPPPPKVRRYELTRYVQAALLDVLRRAGSEHARVAAANALLGMINSDTEKIRAKKGGRRTHANEDAQNYDEECAAAEAEIRALLEEFEAAKTMCGEREARVAEQGAAGADNAPK